MKRLFRSKMPQRGKETFRSLCVCVALMCVRALFGLLIKLQANGRVTTPPAPQNRPACIKCHSSALLLYVDIYCEL